MNNQIKNLNVKIISSNIKDVIILVSKKKPQAYIISCKKSVSVTFYSVLYIFIVCLQLNEFSTLDSFLRQFKKYGICCAFVTRLTGYYEGQ